MFKFIKGKQRGSGFLMYILSILFGEDTFIKSKILHFFADIRYI
jgi:hypothetical protein